MRFVFLGSGRFFSREKEVLTGQWRIGVVLCSTAFLLAGAGCRGPVGESPDQQQTSSARASAQAVVATNPKSGVNSANLIVPGRRVGHLQLGDTRQRVLQLFAKKPNVDEEYTYPHPESGCGTISEIHWLDLELDAAGVFVYLENGHVFQIESATQRFRTAEGITESSSPEEIRRHYPRLRAYQLVHSGADIVGGRDLIYWVGRDQGIAFEFAYHRRADRRLVYRIIVFEPDTEFLPRGCVEEPQEWRELLPFSLEPPNRVASVQLDYGRSRTEATTGRLPGSRIVPAPRRPVARWTTPTTLWGGWRRLSPRARPAYPQWGLSWAYDRYGNRTAQTVTAGTAPAGSAPVDGGRPALRAGRRPHQC